jgi:hypothetical protein
MFTRALKFCSRDGRCGVTHCGMMGHDVKYEELEGKAVTQMYSETEGYNSYWRMDKLYL